MYAFTLIRSHPSAVCPSALLPPLLPQGRSWLIGYSVLCGRMPTVASWPRPSGLHLPPLQDLDWLEWKRTIDLTRPAGRFEVASFVLGAANRDPAKAAADAEGTAYLLAGVEPGAIYGVPRPDVAQIEDGVTDDRQAPRHLAHDACFRFHGYISALTGPRPPLVGAGRQVPARPCLMCSGVRPPNPESRGRRADFECRASLHPGPDPHA